MCTSLSHLAAPSDAHPSLTTLTAPPALDLAACITQLLADWAPLPAVPAEARLGMPLDLPLEFSTVLSGATHHLLVLRSTHDLAAELAYANTGDPGARALGDQALLAFCHLLGGHLMECGLGTGPAGYSLLPSWRSQPQQWPTTLPTSTCVLQVHGHALEARLWELPLFEPQRRTAPDPKR